MKKLIGLVAVALVVMFAASCNKGGEVGPIVEKALNGIISVEAEFEAVYVVSWVCLRVEGETEVVCHRISFRRVRSVVSFLFKKRKDFRAVQITIVNARNNVLEIRRTQAQAFFRADKGRIDIIIKIER